MVFSLSKVEHSDCKIKQGRIVSQSFLHAEGPACVIAWQCTMLSSGMILITDINQ